MASPAAEQFRPLRRVEYDRFVALGTFEGERIELIGGVLPAHDADRAATHVHGG
jgi:hypothetical protein